MHRSRENRKDSERTSRQRLSTLQAIFELNAEPAFIMDRDGKILEANRAFAALAGREVHECPDLNPYEMLPPGQAAQLKAKAGEALHAGSNVIFENEQDGRLYLHTLYPVADSDGYVQRLYVRVQDITELKHAENTAINQQILSDALIRVIPGAFYMFNAEGRFVAWNAYERDVIVGKPESEMANLFGLDTIHPDDREIAGRKMQNILKNGIEESEEVRVLLHGGPGYRWLQISGKRIIINGESFLMGIGSDITEHKQAEDTALKNSEDRFRTLFEEHSAVKLVIDPLNGNIVDANHAAAAFYGWSIEQLCRMRIQQINTLTPEEVTRMMESSRKSEKNQFSFHHRRADGSIRDVDVFSSNIRFAGKDLLYSIVHDVTERKRAETQLKQLSVAIQQSPAATIITDPQGNIEYVNPTFIRHSGYSLEEVQGKNPRILQSGLMPKAVYADLWKTILAGGVWHGELHNRKKNGGLYWESAVISAIRNEDGDIASFVAVKEDITEKKKLWSELITAKEKAEESDRLKTAFLANMSHEIRTPMNGIIGLSEILKDPDLSREEQTMYIGLIDQSCQRLLFLINDIMDISHIEAGQASLQITETPVNMLLHDLFADFKPLAENKGLRLSCVSDLSESESVIETDSAKLKQALRKLVGNALKFTRAGSVEFGYTKKGELLEFYVIDSGIGIPVEMKESIFERFRQVDTAVSRNYEGAGLGLSIARAHIEMLGGTIRVEPAEGRGSAFFFTLPYNPPESMKTPLSSPDVRKPERLSSDLTILLAEDDEISAVLLKKKLNGENATIISAVNGREAVELAERHPEINIVLMDIKMPLMDGFEATRLIKEIRPGLPVIAHSPFTSPDDREKAKEAGFDGFISKPVNREKLLELMMTLLQR